MILNVISDSYLINVSLMEKKTEFLTSARVEKNKM
jgi:hypothetical protein